MSQSTQPVRRYRKYMLYLLLAGCLWFVLHLVVITVDGFSDELHKADVAVVLGNKVHPNGIPSIRLQMRLDRTVQLYRKHYFSSVLVSGGVGKEGHDEAKVMKQYLVKHGLPAKDIIVDSAGNTTFHTMKYTKSLLKQRGWRSVLLISQYFHISRSKLAASRFGIKKVYSAHAIYHFEWREFYSLFREFFGYYAYLLKSYR